MTNKDKKKEVPKSKDRRRIIDDEFTKALKAARHRTRDTTIGYSMSPFFITPTDGGWFPIG